jgi:hypothetical protein
MKPRKAAQSIRRTAQSARRAGAARAATKPDAQVTGLERDGEIRLTQLLRALTGGPGARIKPAH